MVFAHLAVGAGRQTVARPMETEVQRLSNAPCEIDVGRRYRASFTGSEAFCGMEAQRDRNVAKVPIRHLICAVKDRSSVEGDRNAGLVAKNTPRLLRHRPA